MNPTKARLALLQAIADGAVERRYPMLPDSPYDEWDRGPGLGSARRRKVTSRVDELETADFVRLLPRPFGAHYKESRRWDLTTAGRTFLAENGGAP